MFGKNWNQCSSITGMGVRARLESVFDLDWNTHNKHTTLPAYVNDEGASLETTFNNKVTLSMRFIQAQQHQEQLGSRQGQRTDLSLRRHGDEVQGRSDVFIAKIHGFRSKDAYRRAQKVFTQGCALLRAALEKKEVTLSAAALLATLPLARQNEIVQQGKAAMVIAANNIRSKKIPPAKQEGSP